MKGKKMSNGTVSLNNNKFEYKIEQGKNTYVYTIRRVVNGGSTEQSDIHLPTYFWITITTSTWNPTRMITENSFSVDESNIKEFAQAFRDVAYIMESWSKDKID